MSALWLWEETEDVEAWRGEARLAGCRFAGRAETDLAQTAGLLSSVATKLAVSVPRHFMKD